MKKVLGAVFGVLSALGSPVHAQAVPNDGYLVVDNLSDSGRDPGLIPVLCPPGATARWNEDMSATDSPQCWIRKKQVKPVDAQGALDIAYGHNKARVVGIAPVFYTETSTVSLGGGVIRSAAATVIYFRRLP